MLRTLALCERCPLTDDQISKFLFCRVGGLLTPVGESMGVPIHFALENAVRSGEKPKMAEVEPETQENRSEAA